MGRRAFVCGEVGHGRVVSLGVPLTWGDARIALLSGRSRIGFVFADRLFTRG